VGDIGVDDLRSESGRVAAMFGRIAERYDLMNAIMTAGLDRRWRTLAAGQVQAMNGDEVLDVCCGTGDLAFEVARTHPSARVIGLDLSEPMLVRAEEKRATGPFGKDVRFVRGDAMRTCFADERFADVTAAFGVRNLPDLPGAFIELLRITRPGGRLVCLEITTPPAGPGRGFHAVWFDRVVPLLGRLIAGEAVAYSYLPASVRAFPSADGLAGVLHGAGWRRIRYRRMGLGIVALHVAQRPSDCAPAPSTTPAAEAAAEVHWEPSR